MSAIEEEDEELKMAIRMSLEEAEKEKERRALFDKPPGAMAFLERRNTVDLNSPATINYAENKSTKKEEDQESPNSTAKGALLTAPDSALEPPLNRKLRTPLNGSLAHDDDDVVIIEDSPITKPKVGETKVGRTDSELARLLSSMNDNEAAEFLANHYNTTDEQKSAVEPPKPSNSALPAFRAIKPSYSQGLASQASALNLNTSPSNLITPTSPYIAPQRHFKFNWVVTMPHPPPAKRLSYDHLPEYIRLRDLICQDATKAIFTTFKLDMTWLVTHAPKLINIPSVVYHSETDHDIYRSAELGRREGTPRQKMWDAIVEARQRQLSPEHRAARGPPPKEPPFQDIRIRQDPTRKWSTPHAKVILIIYPRWLRVAVTTANLCESDWERKTQGIWFQDFPLKTDTEAGHLDPASSASSAPGGAAPSAANRNGHTLKAFRLNALSQEESARARALARDFEAALKDFFSLISSKAFDLSLFEQYDYRNVRVALVTSVIKSSTLEGARNYGHLKMAGLLSKEPQPPIGTNATAPPQVFIQMSSMGKTSRNWIESIRDSFATEATGSKQTTNLTIVWPTVTFVRNSVDGWMSGGSLCLREKSITDAPHLLRLMIHYMPLQNDRKTVPPHIKSYWKVYSDGTLGWMCLTSSNLSKSAWGEIQKGPKFTMNNYEVGVLFLPSALSLPATFGDDVILSEDGVTRKTVRLLYGPRLTMGTSIIGANTYHDVTLPMPFDTAGKRYSGEFGASGYDDQPWVMDRARLEPDVHGTTYLGSQ